VKVKTYVASDHDLDPDMIDRDALYVIEKLTNAGYKAYLVGGSVRDLLVQRQPKDFDISTSAKPEEIKHVFGRQCLLIGRRFRLAHIRFGKKIIELSTFRAGRHEDELITEDNIWGTPEEDVLRRDFTINGLFYDPFKHEVIDYVGGWEDIHKHVLRVIGDPATRFRQDPVRMIRLLKFRARFGFDVDPAAKQALVDCRQEITKSSPARLLEELMRMLESGAATRFFHLMTTSRMLDLIFPALSDALRGKPGNEIYQYLEIVDTIHQNSAKYPLNRSVLVSCLLFPLLEQRIKEHYLDQGEAPHLGEVMLTTTTLIKDFITSAFTHFPRRISSATNFILTNQYRLTPFTKRRHYPTRMFRNKEFDLVLKFLKIRALADQSLMDIYSNWKQKYLHFKKQGEHRKHQHPHPPPRRRKPPGTQR